MTTLLDQITALLPQLPAGWTAQPGPYANRDGSVLITTDTRIKYRGSPFITLTVYPATATDPLHITDLGCVHSYLEQIGWHFTKNFKDRFNAEIHRRAGDCCYTELNTYYHINTHCHELHSPVLTYLIYEAYFATRALSTATYHLPRQPDHWYHRQWDNLLRSGIDPLALIHRDPARQYNLTIHKPDTN